MTNKTAQKATQFPKLFAEFTCGAAWMLRRLAATKEKLSTGHPLSYHLRHALLISWWWREVDHVDWCHIDSNGLRPF